MSGISSLVEYTDELDHLDETAKLMSDKISDDEDNPPPAKLIKKSSTLHLTGGPFANLLDTPVGSESGTPKKISSINQLVSYGADENITDDSDIDDKNEPKQGSVSHNEDELNLSESIENEKNVFEVNDDKDEIISDGQQSISKEDNTDEIEKSAIKLPPEPAGHCPIELQNKFRRLHEKMINGEDMNAKISHRKDFRNPSIYEKLIEFMDLDEKGSNFDKLVYDPHCWTKNSFYDALSLSQKVEMDRREREKKDRTKIDFVSGVKKEDSKRKSKWDQSGNAVPNVPPVQSKTTSHSIKKKTLQLE